MSEKSTISIGPERDDPPRFTREMAERGRHMVGDQVIREARPRGRPPMAEGERKEKVTLRLSPEVLSYFRDQGEGWQTRIDEVLLNHARYSMVPLKKLEEDLSKVVAKATPRAPLAIGKEPRDTGNLEERFVLFEPVRKTKTRRILQWDAASRSFVPLKSFFRQSRQNAGKATG